MSADEKIDEKHSGKTFMLAKKSKWKNWVFNAFEPKTRFWNANVSGYSSAVP